MLTIHGAKTNEYVGMNGFYTMLIIVPQIVLLAIDVVTQISFVQYLQKTLSGLDSCEIRTDLVLRYLSVAAFLAGMIFDFFECFEMVLCCGHGTCCAWKRKMIKHFSSKSEQTGAKNEFLVWRFGTKTTIAVYRFAVGAQFFLLSETHADLIRNCLAMVFLVELDDLIYQGFTPSFGKEVIQDLPAIEVHSPVQGLPGSHYFHGWNSVLGCSEHTSSLHTTAVQAQNSSFWGSCVPFSADGGRFLQPLGRCKRNDVCPAVKSLWLVTSATGTRQLSFH